MTHDCSFSLLEQVFCTTADHEAIIIEEDTTLADTGMVSRPSLSSSTVFTFTLYVLQAREMFLLDALSSLGSMIRR